MIQPGRGRALSWQKRKTQLQVAHVRTRACERERLARTAYLLGGQETLPNETKKALQTLQALCICVTL